MEQVPSNPPALVILAGLPGVGKTALARSLAGQIHALHLRIDTIEQALRESALFPSDLCDAGYCVAYAVAADNLRLGQTVIADSVNSIPLTRDAWRAVARDAGVPALEVEVVCSDALEHRRRVETRVTDVPGLRLPSWQDVLAREYHAFSRPPLTLDTFAHSIPQNVDTLRAALAALVL